MHPSLGGGGGEGAGHDCFRFVSTREAECTQNQNVHLFPANVARWRRSTATTAGAGNRQHPYANNVKPPTEKKKKRERKGVKYDI